MWYMAVLQDGQRTVCTRALFRTDNPIYTLRSLPIHRCALLRGLRVVCNRRVYVQHSQDETTTRTRG